MRVRMIAVGTAMLLIVALSFGTSIGNADAATLVKAAACGGNGSGFGAKTHKCPPKPPPAGGRSTARKVGGRTSANRPKCSWSATSTRVEVVVPGTADTYKWVVDVPATPDEVDPDTGDVITPGTPEVGHYEVDVAGTPEKTVEYTTYRCGSTTREKITGHSPGWTPEQAADAADAVGVFNDVILLTWPGISVVNVPTWLALDEEASLTTKDSPHVRDAGDPTIEYWASARPIRLEFKPMDGSGAEVHCSGRSNMSTYWVNGGVNQTTSCSYIFEHSSIPSTSDGYYPSQARICYNVSYHNLPTVPDVEMCDDWVEFADGFEVNELQSINITP